jgi:hypothetical protein
MNPIFTLNYPEALVADYLKDHFGTKKRHSVLIPLSAQNKGYDLALVHHTGRSAKMATFQVKSSKAWDDSPGIGPRTGRRTFAHTYWLSRFEVADSADFFILLALYAPVPTSRKGKRRLWHSHLMLFTHDEMASFMASVRLRKRNVPDTHFGFGFDHDKEAFQTRGHALPHNPDFSQYLLRGRHAVIAAVL